MMTLRTFRGIFFLTAAVFSTGLSMCFGADPTAAETAPEYAIEIVIFQYLNPDDGGETGTSLADEPDFTGVRPLEAIPELVPLAPEELKLGGEAYTFRRGANYRLLLHEGWHQKLTDRSHAEAVYVRYPKATERKTLVTIPGLSFTETGEERPIMEGIIQVALERYLHLTVDLVYRTDPLVPTTSYQSDVYIDPEAPQEEIAVSSPVYRLKETRRMRSGEIHYLDHPQIGVIALIRKYDSAAAEAPAATGPEGASPTTTNDPVP
jgi:hypothetical protein